MCGTGGCQDFFRWANLSNDMTDREFVAALSNSVVDNVARKYSSQPQYHEGWKNRYKNELKDCLVYIAEDEAAAAAPTEPEPEPAPRPNRVPAAPAGPTLETDSDVDNGGETGTPSTGAGNNGAGNGGAASGGTESASGTGDSGSGSTGGSASGSTGGSVSGSTNSGSSNGSVDAGEGSDSGSIEGSDTDNSSTENKPSVGEQVGVMIESSMTAGINNGSSSDEGASSKAPESRTDGDASTDDGAKQAETDPKKDDDKNVTSATTTTTTTTTTKASGGNMPKTGDLIVMASLASASLATLGATSIVSGKHKLDQQKKATGEDGSEE